MAEPTKNAIAEARQQLVDVLWLEIGPGATRIVAALDAYLDARETAIRRAAAADLAAAVADADLRVI